MFYVTPHAVSILSGFPLAATHGLLVGCSVPSCYVKIMNYEDIDCCPCCVYLLYFVCPFAFRHGGRYPLGSSMILKLEHLNL